MEDGDVLSPAGKVSWYGYRRAEKLIRRTVGPAEQTRVGGESWLLFELFIAGFRRGAVMQRPLRSKIKFSSLIVFIGALVVTAPNSARAADASGVINVLYATIKSDADAESKVPIRNSNDVSSATLTVRIRISAHSRETNFYGDVPATISNFDPTKGSHEQEVWKDAKCHHERGGFPKMTVISVDGFVMNGEEKLPIAARYRWIGMLLPGDEVMPAKRLIRGADGVGPFIATHTETKRSHLAVDLKLYMLPCSLSVSAN